MQLQSQPCPSAALGGQSGSPNGHLERIRDSIDHVEWMRWSTRYGRAMLAKKCGQNEALGLLVPCVRPELDLRAAIFHCPTSTDTTAKSRATHWTFDILSGPAYQELLIEISKVQ